MANCDKQWNLKVHTSHIRAIVPDTKAGKVLIVLELNMGKVADNWKTIREMISNRADLANDTLAENKDLRERLAKAEQAPGAGLDVADRAALDEMDALATALTAGGATPATPNTPATTLPKTPEIPANP
jgi:hypothetical protein